MFRSLLLLISFICCCVSGYAQETEVTETRQIVIVFSEEEGSPAYNWIARTYTDLFSRLDVKVSFKYLPIARAKYLSGLGEIDGEMFRVKAYEKHTKLLRIPEPLTSFFQTAYVRVDVPVCNLNGWKSLANRNWKVEYELGVLNSEMNLTPIVPAELLSASSTPVAGLRRLKAGAVDIYINTQASIQPLLRTPEFKGLIKPVGVMEEIIMYSYINRKYEDLIPDLVRELKVMKQEGLIEKYRRDEFDQEISCKTKSGNKFERASLSD